MNRYRKKNVILIYMQRKIVHLWLVAAEAGEERAGKGERGHLTAQGYYRWKCLLDSTVG